jgi:phenylalanyl-tRNA synthetase alpha chain
MDQELQVEIDQAKKILRERLDGLQDKKTILKAVELKALYERIPTLKTEQKAIFGQAINNLRQELSDTVEEHLNNQSAKIQLAPIDVSAPFSTNAAINKRPGLLSNKLGSKHPLSQELDKILEIFSFMGFSIVESREIDDDWHMFTSLNFPEDHPARDDYDTFMTIEKDAYGKPWIAPAHTSSMQNRVFEKYKHNLANDLPIAVVIPGRVFRNEDVDTRHEHTFYQLEGVYVSRDVSIGNLIATLRIFLESYYKTTIEVKTQPFYFPFTEPSLEFVMSCPFCSKSGCRICSFSGWIEMLGCGQIHPNVLTAADIDPLEYQGFAWGVGIERLVMLKYAIEDIRLFESGRLDFLRQFSAIGNAL